MVSRRAPVSISDMLAQVLGNVARHTTSARPLQPVWESVVGALTARHTRVISLERGVLHVAVDAKPWRDEVMAQHDDLIRRLAISLGHDVVRRLQVEVA